MKFALLLLDVQQDFLQRQGLAPSPQKLIEQLEKLVEGCRKHHIYIIHIHTQIRKDGTDRMPHWIHNHLWCCVEGSPGIQPPDKLKPATNELRITKQFFSGFGNPLLDETLRQHEIDAVIIAGLYLHGCVRSTVMDAYERNYKVFVIKDAVGSTEPEHAEITQAYLDGRAAQFINSKSFFSRFAECHQSYTEQSGDDMLPVANINGEWLKANKHACYIRRNPSYWNEVLASVPIATVVEVNLATNAAKKVQENWKKMSGEHRIALLDRWMKVLRENQQQLTRLLAIEIGKSVAAGQDEVERAISLVLMTSEQLGHGSEQQFGTNFHVKNHPRGVIAIITPWNNPLAIPVGKIAAALAMGNSVVWKPALEAPRTAMLIVDTLYQAGMPKGLLNLVCGDANTVQRIIEHTIITAVTITGSIKTGRTVSSLCASYNKMLQAELGGNNAAIVWHDFDIKENALKMALAAFSFAGQRCTAIQRFIVERSVVNDFKAALVSAAASLGIGDPGKQTTHLGPLISRTQRENIRRHVAQAIKDGAILEYGNTIPEGFEQGCWLTPVIMSQVTSDMQIFQEEVFGPVAVIIPVDDFETAIKVANDVEHGLVAALYTRDLARRRQFSEEIEAGILTFSAGPLGIHPQAPFGGWKSSMIGPPEHGKWDRQFYERTQVIYDHEWIFKNRNFITPL
jgi:alpha-ketoglutaric semialdehyde dehydrogenase